MWELNYMHCPATFHTVSSTNTHNSIYISACNMLMWLFDTLLPAGRYLMMAVSGFETKKVALWSLLSPSALSQPIICISSLYSPNFPLSWILAPGNVKWVGHIRGRLLHVVTHVTGALRTSMLCVIRWVTSLWFMYCLCKAYGDYWRGGQCWVECIRWAVKGWSFIRCTEFTKQWTYTQRIVIWSCSLTLLKESITRYKCQKTTHHCVQYGAQVIWQKAVKYVIIYAFMPLCLLRFMGMMCLWLGDGWDSDPRVIRVTIFFENESMIQRIYFYSEHLMNYRKDYFQTFRPTYFFLHSR